MGIKSINNLISSIIDKKEIIIIGRGPSMRGIDIEKGNNRFFIFYNYLSSSNDQEDILFISKQHEKRDVNDKKSRNILLETDIYSLLKLTNPIMVGNMTFGVEGLLNYINFIALKEKTLAQVSFIGFDFRKFSIDDDIYMGRNHFSQQDIVNVNSQRYLFFTMKDNYKCLRIYHYGYDVLSDYNPNYINNKSIDEENLTNNVEIVAEITTNHFGDMKRLEQLVLGAKIAGADAVKLQVRDVDTFYSEEKLKEKYQSPFGNSFYEYRKQLELNDQEIKFILNYAENIDIKVFFSVLDVISYERMKKFNLPRIKIPSTISRKKDFLNYVAKDYSGELVISTGMTDDSYEKFILKAFSKCSKIYLLHCISSYPTFPSDVNLNIVKHYENLKTETLIPGYSSHDIGYLAASMAVAAGAKMIEKHIKIGSKHWAHFDSCAMDVFTEFPLFVQTMRSVEKMLGSGIKKILEVEHHKY